MSKEQKQSPQWKRIELDYRAGIKSLRQIAGEQGIGEGAIRKRAKRDDWSPDLSERIQDKAEQLLRKEAVRSEVSAQRSASEREVVDANAQAVALIQLAHRRDRQRARKITNALMDELEQMADAVAMLPELGELLCAPDDNGIDPAELAHACLHRLSWVDIGRLNSPICCIHNLARTKYRFCGLAPCPTARSRLCKAHGPIWVMPRSRQCDLLTRNQPGVLAWRHASIP